MRGIKEILKEYKTGKINDRRAVEMIQKIFFTGEGDVKIDVHRKVRHGFPEVIYGQGKDIAHLISAISKVAETSGNVLVTRVGPEIAIELEKRFKEFIYDKDARCFYRYSEKKIKGKGEILILSAGTSDRAVVQEAYITVMLMGNRVRKITDVGVAGVHRLFAHFNTIKRARVIIVVAGMEGALPSVVGGAVGKPIIAVPTSQGYGTGMGGLSALLGMLNSCAPNVAVVNIDNGFGAGYIASLINRL